MGEAVIRRLYLIGLSSPFTDVCPFDKLLRNQTTTRPRDPSPFLPLPLLQILQQLIGGLLGGIDKGAQN